MSGIPVREWQLRSKRTEGGLELLGARVAPGAINTTLQRAFAALDSKGRSFLLIRLDTTDRDGIEAALKQASALVKGVRISLAIDVATVGRLDLDRGLDTRGAGLLLDDVDASTPPGALLHPSLEAVRFRPEFIAAARGSLRAEIVLRASLGIARDLGLATLGSGDASDQDWSLASQFDYTSRDVDEERIASAMRHPGFQRSQPDPPTFQLSR